MKFTFFIISFLLIFLNQVQNISTQCHTEKSNDQHTEAVEESSIDIKETIAELQQNNDSALKGKVNEADLIIKAKKKFDDKNLDEIRKMNSKYGYTAEFLPVETIDGYHISLHRLRGRSKSSFNDSDKMPVLFVHGLLDCSASWYISADKDNKGNSSLPFLLADHGHDVFLLNVRGNRFARSNKNFSPNGPNSHKFWAFSWHEIGSIDIPSAIDKILDVNKKYKKIILVGYSQGVTSSFVLLSTRTEYNEKIFLFIALSPVVFMNHMTSPVKSLAIGLKDVAAKGDKERSKLSTKFMADHVVLEKAAIAMCKVPIIFKHLICPMITMSMVGWHQISVNTDKMTDFLSIFPAGASTHQIAHYGVLMGKTGSFKEYDWGETENQKRYGHKTPERYPIERITCKMAFYYGANDKFVSVPDAKTLVNSFAGKENVIEFYKIPDKGFNHLDFMYGINVYDQLYEHVCETLESALNGDYPHKPTLPVPIDEKKDMPSTEEEHMSSVQTKLLEEQISSLTSINNEDA